MVAEAEAEVLAVEDPGLCSGAKVGEEDRPGGQERALTPGLALESSHQRFRRESPRVWVIGSWTFPG